MAERCRLLGTERRAWFRSQQVILPDLNAGCSMADMPKSARWKTAGTLCFAAGLKTGEILPLTYMNRRLRSRPSAVNVADWSGTRPTPAGI